MFISPLSSAANSFSLIWNEPWVVSGLKQQLIIQYNLKINLIIYFSLTHQGHIFFKIWYLSKNSPDNFFSLISCDLLSAACEGLEGWRGEGARKGQVVMLPNAGNSRDSRDLLHRDLISCAHLMHLKHLKQLMHLINLKYLMHLMRLMHLKHLK